MRPSHGLALEPFTPDTLSGVILSNIHNDVLVLVVDVTSYRDIIVALLVLARYENVHVHGNVGMCRHNRLVGRNDVWVLFLSFNGTKYDSVPLFVGATQLQVGLLLAYYWIWHPNNKPIIIRRVVPANRILPMPTYVIMY